LGNFMPRDPPGKYVPFMGLGSCKTGAGLLFKRLPSTFLKPGIPKGWRQKRHLVGLSKAVPGGLVVGLSRIFEGKGESYPSVNLEVVHGEAGLRKLFFVIIAIAAFFVGIFLYAFFRYLYPQWFGVNVPPGEAPPGKILVIAPHPDDETLAAAGVIARSVKKGIPVKVVVVTCGDGYPKAASALTGKRNPGAEDFLRLGKTRQKEAVAAMRVLGLPEEDLIFLGYPDSALEKLWDSNWEYENVYRGAATKTTSVPYTGAREPGAPYCGQSLVDSLTELIEDFRPTTVYYPHPGDEHPDHWATNAFVQYVLAKMNYQGQAFTYLVHCSYWPEPPLAQPDKPLKPPLEMTGEGGRWFDVPLTAEEIELKRRALNCYATQQKVMKPFLSAFIRSTELFCACSVPSVPVLTEAPASLPVSDLEAALAGARSKSNLGRLSLRLRNVPSLDSLGILKQGEFFWLVLKFPPPVSEKVNFKYELDLRFIFPGGQAKRLAYQISGQDVSVLAKSPNALIFPPAQVTKKENYLLIAIPDQDLRGALYVLFAGKTYLGGIMFAKTGYRLLKV